MKKKPSISKRITALALSLIMTCLLGITDAYAAVPGPNASITEENIFSILEEYDKEGYFFLQESKKDGSNFLVWWQGEDEILESMCTAVHEECHHYTTTSHDYTTNLTTYRYRVDEGLDMNVSWEEASIFYSYEMGKSIPDSLRYSRFNTYIGESVSENTAANIYGPYGMLDELNAYGWGLNDNLCMYNYLCDCKKTMLAKEFLDSHAISNIEGVSEFKLWIYSYLLYAKENYPDVYASIVNNKDFIKAYQAIDKRISRSITQYIKISGKKILKDTCYKAIKKELKKSKYKEIKAALAGKGSAVVAPKKTNECGWTTVRYIREADDGIKIMWNKAQNSDGSLIYRKEEGGSFVQIKEVNNKDYPYTSSFEYTDTNIASQKTYIYYVVAYKMVDGKRVLGKSSIEHSVVTYPQVKIKSANYSDGKITVKWKPQSIFDDYEVKQEVTHIEYTTNSGAKVTSTGATTNYAYKGASSLDIYPEYGSGIYKISVRGIIRSGGSESFSKWSKVITLEI